MIDAAAATWAVRLDRGELSAEERQAIEDWAAADIRRQGALVRAMAILARTALLADPSEEDEDL